jgi:CRP-like cAMP-binding protein/cytochrome P450
LQDPTAFFVAAYSKYGPAFRVTAFGKEYTILTGKEALRFFQSTGEKYFSRESFYRRFALELGSSTFILGAQGSAHARLRRMMKLAFSRQVASAFIPAMVQALRQQMSSWKVGDRVNVMDSMAALSFEAYSYVMCNRSLDKYFRDALLFANTSMRVGAMVRPALFLYFPRYQRAKHRIYKLLATLLDEHRQSARGSEQEFDVLDALESTKNTEEQPFTDRELISSALYGFIGTLVYMNRLLSYVLYEILKDPNLYQKVSAEADQAFAAGIPDPESLRRMKYLYSAYLESLRFHPVALGLPFRVEQDFIFHDYKIRKGSQIVISPVPIHFSPESYSQPNRFDAARCMAPRHEHHGPATFAPFGYAGRVCAAVGLVEIITLVTLSTLFRTVRLQLEPPDYSIRTKVDPLPGPDQNLVVEVIERRPTKIVVPTPEISVEDELSTVLPGIAETDLDRIVSRVKTVNYTRGQNIIVEGEVAREFFIIMKGTVEVVKQPPGQAGTILATLGPGEYFGEIGLLRRVNRTSSVRAASDSVEVLVLDREEFIAMVSNSDLVSRQIADVVRRRIMSNRLAATLPGLTDEQVVQFLSGFNLATYAAGAEIVRQSDAANSFYIIVQGRVEVSNRRPGGHEIVLAELGPGEWFGEIGLMLGRPRGASVRAKSDLVEVMMADRETFSRLVGQPGSTRDDISQLLFERLLAPLEGFPGINS